MAAPSTAGVALTPAEALEEIGRGAVLVTASRRLARVLRRQYDADRRADGAEVWRTPSVLPWQAWLESLWEDRLYGSGGQLRLLPLRLDAAQECLVWERVIGRSSEASELLSLTAAAEAAQTSWTTMLAWRLDRRDIEAAAGDDTRAFLIWSRAFEHICEVEGWLEQARVPDYLASMLAGGVLPERVLLAGFDELTPQQEGFLEACRRAGAQVERVAGPPPQNAEAVRFACAGRAEELAAAARWCRALLEGGASGRIGVVVAGLESVRSEAERIFTEILDPPGILPATPQRARAFNISAAPALASYPVIHAALLALHLDPIRNEAGRLGAFLRSGFLRGGDSERSSRALLDARLRDIGGTEISLDLVIRLCRERSCACPVLREALESWREARSSLPALEGPGAWARGFSRLLAQLGWPGERSLDSREYQAAESWSKLLSNFARLDAVNAVFDYREALARLERMVRETAFQPESEEAPIQILGPLEASGLEFDHLWVAGLDEEAWPAAARPDPFLPLSLQRARGLPHASPERELEFARLVTSRLRASAPRIVFSHAQRHSDRELGPSALIRGIREATAAEIRLSDGSFIETLAGSAPLESFEDSRAPALAPDTWQRGGTRVFQYQALCPFRAFAELRLGALPLETPAPGLGRRDRGTLIHAALESVWNELKSHERLCRSTAEEVSAIVRNAVAGALARIAEKRAGALPARFSELEQQRVERLLTAWLELEKRRLPFTVIQPEEERYIELSGIRAKVKIDRIDRLEDGREAVIDYKTGEPKISDWESDRPAEPQVPLYAVSHEGPLGAALFGQVRAGEICFKGLSSSPLAVPGAAADDLESRRQEWRATLERLGEAFREGRAEVDPKNPASCRTCSLAGLCRIAEAEFETSALTGEAD